jgi:tetratricopeptide (TPR) repeat protein
MVLCNYAAVMMDKGEYQKAEVLFKKTLDIQAVPNAYYGLALLYRMAGQLEAARAVLETYFTRFSHQKAADNSPIHDEARKLYNEISAELRVQEKSH